MPYPNNPYGIYQPQIQYQPSGLSGRVVNDFNEIMANDVPMNGTYAYFVKSDLSEIQARAWTADGKIIPVVFRPVIENRVNPITETKQGDLGLLDALTKRFDEIQERFDTIEEFFNKQTTTRRKKEADAE